MPCGGFLVERKPIYVVRLVQMDGCLKIKHRALKTKHLVRAQLSGLTSKRGTSPTRERTDSTSVRPHVEHHHDNRTGWVRCSREGIPAFQTVSEHAETVVLEVSFAICHRFGLTARTRHRVLPKAVERTDVRSFDGYGRTARSSPNSPTARQPAITGIY